MTWPAGMVSARRTTLNLAATSFAALAGALFLALAMTRRLNFDESLALRAGWLDLAGEPSAPAFLMPWTLFSGAVGRLIPDPGVVFIALRLLAAGGVAWAFAAALRAAGVIGCVFAAAAWLALANVAFATHALEFRYDAAVLILLLVAYRLLVLGGSPTALGVIAGILALHHLKGAYYALGVAAVFLSLSSERGRDLRRFSAGAAGTMAGWLMLLLPLGLFGRFVESVRSFYSLATGSARAPLIEALGPTLQRDLAWWLVVLVAIARVAWRRRGEVSDRRDLVALTVAALGVGFWIVHPHAWAYLAALPVPFLLVVSSRALDRGWSELRWLAAAAAVGVLLQFASASAPPFAHVARGFAAPIAAEVAMLRELRRDARPDDRVLDPSGIVYFVPPCVDEWYIDTLLLDRMAAGDWMRKLEHGIPAACSLVLNTYRLNALPRPARDSLAREFLPLASGLAVRRDRSVRRAAAELPGNGRVESFW